MTLLKVALCAMMIKLAVAGYYTINCDPGWQGACTCPNGFKMCSSIQAQGHCGSCYYVSFTAEPTGNIAPDAKEFIETPQPELCPYPCCAYSNGEYSMCSCIESASTCINAYHGLPVSYCTPSNKSTTSCLYSLYTGAIGDKPGVTKD